MKNGGSCGWVRCGIILAGGEGQRLKPLINHLRGDGLPKQYVNFIGNRSMLEHTFSRAEKVISPERIFTVVSREHLSYPGVRRQLFGRSRCTVVAQPENKETGPGIFLPLMHVYKRYPESAVAIFPSDHFIVEEDLFMAHVAVAFHAIEQNPSLFVLLGIKPEQAEPEYGYVLPDRERRLEPIGLSRVEGFIEKPRLSYARELILKGALWNTMVIVFRTKTLLSLMRDLTPEHYDAFQQILKALGTRHETERIEEVYRQMKPLNFSKGFLEALPPRSPASLWVLPVQGVFWSDWGLPRSVENVLRQVGYLARLYSESGLSKNRLFKVLDGSSTWKKE